MLISKTQSLIKSLSLGLIIFFSGSGISNGDGISVCSNSALSIPLALSGSSIAS
jgi:hypothetical protein